MSDPAIKSINLLSSFGQDLLNLNWTKWKSIKVSVGGKGGAGVFMSIVYEFVVYCNSHLIKNILTMNFLVYFEEILTRKIVLTFNTPANTILLW